MTDPRGRGRYDEATGLYEWYEGEKLTLKLVFDPTEFYAWLDKARTDLAAIVARGCRVERF